MAVEIRLIGKDLVSVMDFKNIAELCLMLNIKDREVKVLNHKDLSFKFPDSINKAIDYYLRFEYKYYKFLTEETNT